MSHDPTLTLHPPASSRLSADWLLRFGGIARLYGTGSLERLAAARVAALAARLQSVMMA